MNLFTFSFDRPGIRQLAKRILVLLLGFLLAYVVVSFTYRQKLTRPIDLFIKKIQPLTTEQNHYEVIFLGDSHPGGAIKHRFLPDQFYNLGFPNHNLRDQLLLLKWAHSRSPEIEYVVLQADFHIFAQKAEESDDPRRAIPYADYSEIRKTYELSHGALLKQYLYYYFPLLNPRRRFSLPEFGYHYFHSVLHGEGSISAERYRLDQHNDLNYFREFRWDRVSSKRKKFAVRQRIYRQFGPDGPHLLPKMKKAFREIIDYTRKNGLKIIFVRYPVTDEYLEKVPLSKEERREFRSLLETENSVLNLNFSRVFSNREHYFRNSDHLNYRGSRAFTKLFLQGFNEQL